MPYVSHTGDADNANDLQGELQIAATLAIVGSCIIDFPKEQSKRVVIAYIGKIMRWADGSAGE